MNKVDIDNMNLASQAFNLWLSNDLDAYKLEDLAKEHGKSIEELMLLINKWFERKAAPCPTAEERQRKKEAIIKSKTKKRAITAKDCFNYYLEKDLSAQALDELIQKYNLHKQTILNYISDYKDGKYAEFNIIPSDEDIIRYNEALKQRKENKRKNTSNINLSKEIYEAYLKSNGGKEVISMYAKKYYYSTSHIISLLSDYRKRVVEPKPSKEEELKYLSIINRNKKRFALVYKLLDAPIEELESLIKRYDKESLLAKIEIFKNEDPTSDKYVKELDMLTSLINEGTLKKQEVTDDEEKLEAFYDIITEYLSSDYYVITTVLNKYRIPLTMFNRMASSLTANNDMAMGVYQKYLMVSSLRKIKLINLAEEIYKKTGANPKYNIIDLSLDVKGDVWDFKAALYSYFDSLMSDMAFVKKIDQIIYNSGRHTISEEEINNLKYSYNGVEFTNNLKTYVVKFLTEHNIPLTKVNVLSCFEKYVRGEMSFAYQII